MRAGPRARVRDSGAHPLLLRPPYASAARRVVPEQVTAFCGVAVYLSGWFLVAPAATFAFVAGLWAAGFSSLIAFRLWAALASQVRTGPGGADPARGGDLPVYSVLVPLYREAAVVAPLMRALERLDYPRALLDVKLLVEPDDRETLVAAQRCAPPDFEIVVSPDTGPRTKPKALVHALTFARGELLTIYDAEDRPHPAQLRAAVAAFARGGPDLVCVQAPLAFYNGTQNWLTRCFQLEYVVHFHVILPALLRLGAPIPLGGTSNHFRTETLRAAGGWDPYNVTEDADLGFRLDAVGKVAMIAPPTMEEATCTCRAWIRQRSRWLKGYAQTILVHTRPSEQRFSPVKAASLWLTLGGALVAAMLHGPSLPLLVAAALIGPEPVLPALALLASGYVSMFAGALAAARLSGRWELLLAAMLTPFYWPLQTFAVAIALRQLVCAPFRWEKTVHGVNRGAAAH